MVFAVQLTTSIIRIGNRARLVPDVQKNVMTMTVHVSEEKP